MKTGFKDISYAYNDWVTRSPKSDVTKRWVYAVINDCVASLLTADNYVDNILLLKVNKGKVDRPPYMKRINQVAFSLCKTLPSREHISAYMSKSLSASNCRYHLALLCNTCGENCTCGSNSYHLELQSDRDYPEIKLLNYPQFNEFYSSYKGPLFRSTYVPGFYLIKPATGSFFNTNEYIDRCVNLNTDTGYNYKLKPDHIEVNFPEGWLLLSYEGYAVSNNFLAIPDIPKVYTAIRTCIDMYIADYKFKGNPNNSTQALYATLSAKYLEDYYAAKAELSKIEKDRWLNIIQQLNYLIPLNGEYDLYQDHGDLQDKVQW